MANRDKIKRKEKGVYGKKKKKSVQRKRGKVGERGRRKEAACELSVRGSIAAL